jgi:putative MATE family efflux protein
LFTGDIINVDAQLESTPKLNPDQPSPTGTDGTAASADAHSGGAPGFWALLREALVGSRRDLTAMPLGRAIFLLAIPMVLEMGMESIFTLADIFWLARVGPEAVATAGLTETLMTLIYTAAMGMAIGVGAVVSRRTGAQDRAGAGRAAVQAVLLGLGASVVFGVAGALAGPSLLALMGASPAVQSTGAGFSRVMLGGSGTVVMLFLINAAFRGAGDAALTLRTLALSNSINILLGPVLIFGLGPAPRLGVAGAAVATTIGRGVGVLYQFRNLSRGAGRLQVSRAEVRVDRETLRTILTIARSAVWQVFIGTSSWIFLVRIIATFGSQVLAGYTLAMRVVMFTLLPSWGLGNAAATLVGQSLGAGNPARGERAVWRAATYNLIFLGSVGLLLMLGPELILRLFTSNPVVVAEGARCLRIVAAGYPLYAFAMVVTQAFNGAGNSKTPTRINLGCFWLFEIPLAFLLTRALGVGSWGAYLAIPLAFSAMAISSVVLFRRGKWKTVKI